MLHIAGLKFRLVAHLRPGLFVKINKMVRTLSYLESTFERDGTTVKGGKEVPELSSGKFSQQKNSPADAVN